MKKIDFPVSEACCISQRIIDALIDSIIQKEDFRGFIDYG